MAPSPRESGGTARTAVEGPTPRLGMGNRAQTRLLNPRQNLIARPAATCSLPLPAAKELFDG
jgi:hypothetical protein